MYIYCIWTCNHESQKWKDFSRAVFSCVYFGPERKSSRYSNDPVQPQACLKEVSKDLAAEYEGNNFIFSKDMAYYLDGNYDILRLEGLSEYKHSFLIRNPKKAVPSLYRASTNAKKTGWDFFDPEEVGFRQLLELYNFVVKELDSSPVIMMLMTSWVLLKRWWSNIVELLV